MIKLSINVTRIPRERIKPGKNGKYCDFVLHENKNGPDKFGNDGFVAMDVTKEERQAGVRGDIIGNWKHVGQGTAKPAPRKAVPVDDIGDEEIPF